ncbi:MAG: VCBS repeat-containing protein [Clostridiaceae bacterium]|nr:VCBS repeat-containing protein [Clostridiaceae bacterium]
MKLKIIFLKKKNIYYTMLAIIILILLTILLYTKKSTTTFSTITDNKTIKADLTGDGVEDILYINTNNDKYFVQVNTKNTSLYLKPNIKLNSIGTYSPFWPMKVTLLDVNRDKVPEIFIQSQEKGTSIQHVFVWNNNDFKNVFSSSNNIIGFMDCKNNKTPKIISENISNAKISQSNYVLINNDLHNFNFNFKDTFLGNDTILSFIKYVQDFPYSEPYKPSNIFFPGISGSDLSILGKLAGNNSAYAFQDGLFMDTKWNMDGDVTEVKWILNFKTTSNNDSSIVKTCKINLSLKATLKNDGINYYKIYAISTETN